MNRKDKLVILITEIFSYIQYSFSLYLLQAYNYPVIFYSYLLVAFYLGNLLGAILYGQIIEINRENYIFYNFIGLLATLISYFFLLFPEKFELIFLSVLINFSVGSAILYTYFIVEKDEKLYYYYTLFDLISFILAQILLLSKIDFKILTLSIFFIFSFTIFALFFLYFKKLLEFIINSIKEDYGILGMINSFMDYLEKKESEFILRLYGKPSVISFINLIFSIIISITWTILIQLSSSYNLFYPAFLAVYFSLQVFTFKLLKNANNFYLSFIGILLRFPLLLILLIKIDNIFLLFLFYSLAGLSYSIYAFYLRGYILKNNVREYGWIIFFEYIGSIIGPLVLNLPGMNNIIVIFIVLSVLFFVSFVLIKTKSIIFKSSEENI